MAFALPAIAQAGGEDPVEESDPAGALLSSPEIAARSAALFKRTVEAPTAGPVLEALNAHAGDPALDPALRDAVLHHFIQRLRGAGPGALPSEALDWLKHYRPRAMRVHEESASALVPLFDIPARAAGLENQWRYESGRLVLLRAGAGELGAHLEQMLDDPRDPRAAGMRSALEDLPPATLERLSTLAQAHPAAAASALYPSIELSLGRVERAAAWIAGAPAQSVTEFLLEAGRRDAPVPMALHRAALDHPDAAVRAQAMARITAEVSRDVEGRRAWTYELTARLADPEAGAAAALQLARIGSGEVLKALRARAAKGDLDPVAARRIELIDRLRRTVSEPPPQGGPRP